MRCLNFLLSGKLNAQEFGVSRLQGRAVSGADNIASKVQHQVPQRPDVHEDEPGACDDANLRILRPTS